MNRSDKKRNSYMLHGTYSKSGYMRWWHSFSGISAKSGKQRTFFIEYFIINPALGHDMPILGQHPYYRKRGMKPSYGMVKAGVFPAEGEDGLQLHAFCPISSLMVAREPLIMQMEDCFYSENRIYGEMEITPEEAEHRFFMTDAGSIKWDLEVYKAVACHTGLLASHLACALRALESYWHGEGIRTFFRGSVTLNGETYEVLPETSHGYADKHWGRSFNRPLLQLASSRLTSERTGKELKHSALVVHGCCPRLLIFPLKHRLMIQLTYMGEDYEFGIFKPGPFSRCRWQKKETNRRYIWHIKARTKKTLIKISYHGAKDDALILNYESPEGILADTPLFSGGNGAGSIELYRLTPEGEELFDTLHFTNGFWAWQDET